MLLYGIQDTKTLMHRLSRQMTEEEPTFTTEVYSQYPYLDHSYFAVKTDALALQEQLMGPPRGGRVLKTRGGTIGRGSPRVSWGSESDMFREIGRAHV